MSTQEQYQPAPDERLLDAFDPPTYDEWRAEVERLLKGAPYDKIMLTPTPEGIELQPMYRRQDVENMAQLENLPGFAPFLRDTELLGYHGLPWEVAQELPYPTYEAFNEALRHDLERGQTAVNLKFDQATQFGLDPDQVKPGEVGAGGTSIASIIGLAKALDGVDLAKYPIYLQAGIASLPATALLIALFKKRDLDLKQLRGGVTFDPLLFLARYGSLPIKIEALYRDMHTLTQWAADNTPVFRTIGVDGQVYHNSGASAVQELAFSLATGVEYLRAMTERGLKIDAVAPRIRFTFALGANFFMEIAKLRAARLLWANVVKAFGGSETSQKMMIHGRTSLWSKTIHDPYVNMLRTTTEAFSGIVGGCDSLHVGAFDEIMRLPDTFSRRIARNTHIILSEESHVDRVIDPAGGSWYAESLTNSVAEAAWKLFQDIESKGGMLKALQSGFPQEWINQTRTERYKNIAKRKTVIVGTNMYPNLDEKPLEPRQPDYEAIYKERAARLQDLRTSADHKSQVAVLDRLASLVDAESEDVLTHLVEAALHGATIGEMTKTLYATARDEFKVDPVPQHRAAEMFEKLRQTAAVHLAKTGARPRVFLANMGPVKQHKARADFSHGFFAVGGFEVLNNNGFPTVEAATDAALEAAADIVVICSTDDTYPVLVPPLVGAIKKARPHTIMVVAGRPKDYIDDLKAAGVDEFIYLGADVQAMLSGLLDRIGG